MTDLGEAIGFGITAGIGLAVIDRFRKSFRVKRRVRRRRRR